METPAACLHHPSFRSLATCRSVWWRGWRGPRHATSQKTQSSQSASTWHLQWSTSNWKRWRQPVQTGIVPDSSRFHDTDDEDRNWAWTTTFWLGRPLKGLKMNLKTWLSQSYDASYQGKNTKQQTALCFCGFCFRVKCSRWFLTC